MSTCPRLLGSLKAENQIVRTQARSFKLCGAAVSYAVRLAGVEPRLPAGNKLKLGFQHVRQILTRHHVWREAKWTPVGRKSARDPLGLPPPQS